MMLRQLLIGACVVFSTLASAEAQVKSGPAEGAEIMGFQVQAVVGNHAGNEVDFLAERKDKTTVFLFVAADKFDRPIFRYIKTLDKALAEQAEGTAGVEVVAVWLSDDAAKSKAYLTRAQGSLKFEHTACGVFAGEKMGPDGWGINTDAHLTTVIVKEGHVVRSFGYRSTNETDVPEVVSALKSAK